MKTLAPCPFCQVPTPPDTLAEAHQYAFWRRPEGACPACVQHYLLQTLLDEGHAAFHERVQIAWPLDAQAAFGALPTPLRLHADPRFSGRGVTLAMVDSGFYPHPDLVLPHNRIRALVEAGTDPVRVFRFSPDETPRWPGWDAANDTQWHGLMTSVAAAGNGLLSHGLYRGLASEANLVLLQVRDEQGRITNDAICRALYWVVEHGPALGVRVVNLSVGGDLVWGSESNPVDDAVAALAQGGITVAAAAGNDGQRRLVPPATAPLALTVGGLDDNNTFDPREVTLWHSNYGEAANGAPKPELVAPSIWVAAPLLPGTAVAGEARKLFETRRSDDEARIADLKLITPHYQHVDGTSFAAPLVASAIACMLEANPALTPLLVRDVLRTSACAVPGVSPERQGAGALDAGRALALALQERHTHFTGSPEIGLDGVTFTLHDHASRRVQVLGSWDGWQPPGLDATPLEGGVWTAHGPLFSSGQHAYKFLLDGHRWLDDPANPHKSPDGFGGLNSVLDMRATDQRPRQGDAL